MVDNKVVEHLFTANRDGGAFAVFNCPHNPHERHISRGAEQPVQLDTHSSINRVKVFHLRLRPSDLSQQQCDDYEKSVQYRGG